MSYHGYEFLLLFLPAVIFLHYITPQKHRWKIILIANVVFFWSVSGKLLMFLIASIVSIHYAALWMNTLAVDGEKLVQSAEKEQRKGIKKQIKQKQQMVLIGAVLFNIGILLCLKYLNFFGTNINHILVHFKAPAFFHANKFAMPIGISFYTLQAVSYLADVYRGKIQADRNLGRVALFMSFFPVITEGPICRYSDTANSLYEGKRITYVNLVRGFQRIIFGVFKKVVVADRLNVFVRNVFNQYNDYDGGTIFIAMLMYTCQLYMDFSGVIDIVIGVGEIFGVKIPENFRQPFFSKNISEFWTRWHITLGTWFRDYVYYPMSLSKPLKKLTSKARKKVGSYYGPLVSGSIALGTVWLLNGLWHGSAWNYIFFGFYHFVLIFSGNLFEPLIRKTTSKLHIDREKTPYKIMQIFKTFVLINVGELFFRANGLKAGLIMFKKMVTEFSFSAFSGKNLFSVGMDKKDFLIVAVSLVIVFAISVMREKGISIGEKIMNQKLPVRWLIYYAALMAIVIFGAYGAGYAPVDPMYAEF